MKQIIKKATSMKLFLLMLFVMGLTASVACASGTPKLDKHKEKGVSCSSCHTKGKPFTLPDDSTCLGCHGSYEELAKKTAKLEDIKAAISNPHKSHTGEARCTGCHKNHAASVLMCNQCHSPKFEMKVP